MSVTKAAIDIEKGASIGLENRIECMFNPTEFTISKGATWEPVAVEGKGQPQMHFVKSNPGTFRLDLTFDTTTSGSAVTAHTDLLLRLIEPNKNLPSPTATTKRPPFVWFSWGHWKSFKAFVRDVSVNFTYFSSEGVPLRAKAGVSFEQPEEDEAWPLQNPTSHTPTPHRVHQVQRGETLDRIANTYYSDSTEWRRIAAANRITDPLGISVGSLLVIPRREMTRA